MTNAPNTLPNYEKYKESGVIGVSDIPAHWKSVPLCTVSKIKSVANCPHKDLLSVYLNKGVVKFSDVDEKRTNATSIDLSSYQSVSPGDFVLNNQQAWRGSVGVSTYEGIVSPAYIILSLGRSYHPTYANYLFRDQIMVGQYLVNSKGVGTIQRNLYWHHLKRANTILPPYNEQEAIANFLDEKTAQIDQAIEIKEKQIALLQERKQILIQNAVTRGLNTEIPMKDSGVDWIGQIPDHWETKRLKYVLKERNERSKHGEEPLFMVSQVHGLVVRSDYHEKAEVADSNIDNKIVYNGDLVFNKLKAHLGVFFKSEIEFEGLVSPDYAVYRSYKYINDLEYLEVLFRHPLCIAEFIVRATGIVEGLIRLYTGDLYEISIPVPPCEEQGQILEAVKKIRRDYALAVDKQLQQIEKLKDYRASLINSAVTGKIKVV